MLLTFFIALWSLVCLASFWTEAQVTYYIFKTEPEQPLFLSNIVALLGLLVNGFAGIGYILMR